MGLFVVNMAIAIVIPFALTYFFRKFNIMTKAQDIANAEAPLEALEEKDQEVAATVGTLVNVKSPLNGQARELSEATDPVFAQGVMGQGVLIDPSDGKLVSPFDGVVSALFPTKHAIGLISTDGVELLMHIGMDTVNLDGKGFEAHVKQGDHVKTGDSLITFDLEALKAAGYVVETPVIITNQDAYQSDVTIVLPHAVKHGEELITATKV